MKRIALIGLLVALVIATPASATQTGNGYRWPRPSLSQPAVATVHPDVNLSPAWLGYVQGAIAAWNAGQTNLRITLGSSATCSVFYNGGGICVWEVNKPTFWWWGLASMGGYIYGGITMITGAYIQLNDAKVNPADPAQAWQARYITCHELGETIGLHDHSDTNDPASSYLPTCLTNDFSNVQDSPSSEDYATLQSIYSTVFPVASPPPPCRKRCR